MLVSELLHQAEQTRMLRSEPLDERQDELRQHASGDNDIAPSELRLFWLPGQSALIALETRIADRAWSPLAQRSRGPGDVYSSEHLDAPRVGQRLPRKSLLDRFAVDIKQLNLGGLRKQLIEVEIIAVAGADHGKSSDAASAQHADERC